MKCPNCNHVWAISPRSSKQNRAYFKLVVEFLAKQCQCSKEAMHKALAGEFLGFEKVYLPDKTVVNVEKSTTELSTKEFMTYIERIQRYAAENGLVIPDPNEELCQNRQ